jgi:hypothetical protein
MLVPHELGGPSHHVSPAGAIGPALYHAGTLGDVETSAHTQHTRRTRPSSWHAQTRTHAHVVVRTHASSHALQTLEACHDALEGRLRPEAWESRALDGSAGETTGTWNT